MISILAGIDCSMLQRAWSESIGSISLMIMFLNVIQIRLIEIVQGQLFQFLEVTEGPFTRAQGSSLIVVKSKFCLHKPGLSLLTTI